MSADALAELYGFGQQLPEKARGRFDELIAALANDARRERIVISRSSIDWVKWAVVYLFAVLILVTIAFVHIDNSGTAAISARSVRMTPRSP